MASKVVHTRFHQKKKKKVCLKLHCKENLSKFLRKNSVFSYLQRINKMIEQVVW